MTNNYIILSSPAPELLWKKSVEIAERAIEVLQEQGWTQGRYVNSDSQVCTVGALRKASADLPAAVINMTSGISGIDSQNYNSRVLLMDTLYRSIDESVIVWNDRPERSVEDVILLLKKGAETLRNTYGVGVRHE